MQYYWRRLVRPKMGSWFSGSRQPNPTPLSVPVKKKEPVTPEVIELLFAHYVHYGSTSASLLDLRVLNLCVSGYTGFFRCKELVQLGRRGFQFEHSFMRISVQRSKTAIYKNKYVNATIFFSLFRFIWEIEDSIFRPLTVFLSSNGSFKCDSSHPWSYCKAREIVLSAFDVIVPPRQDYGLHGLRAGGTTAAANAQVTDTLFKSQRRWISDKTKEGYIKDKIQSLLSVSLSLSI